MGRDHRTGLPNRLIPCPSGARNTSDSCRKSRCEYVSIPLRNRSQFPPTGDDFLANLYPKFLILLLILIFLKLLFIVCGSCCTLCLPY